MTTRILQVFAWTALLGIAAATLSPIALRPRLPMDLDLERSLAYFVVGLLFALAYPRQIWLAVLVVMIGTISLEVLQELRPDRHGRLHDALVKAAGAIIGIAFGWVGAQAVRMRAQ